MATAYRAVPRLGLGISWRPELALVIDRYPHLGFVEVIAEDLDARGRLPAPLECWRRRGLPIVPHGLGLSLGGAHPVDLERVDHLCRLAVRLDAPLVSEHIAFVRADGLEAGHLLPVPRTHEALDVLVRNVRAVQERLGCPLALENIARVFDWPAADMDEADFLTVLLERTGAGLLLDIANVYANSRNHGGDPVAFLDRLPLARIAYVHVAGGAAREGIYHDTHAHPIPSPVLSLLEELCSRVYVPGVLLERDEDIPPDEEVFGELDAIRAAMDRGARRRENAHDVCGREHAEPLAS